MIIDVKHYETLFRISLLIDKGVFKHIDYTSDQFFKYLLERWDKDQIRVFAAVDKGNILGFAVCSVQENVIRKKPQVFIDLAFVSNDAPKETGIDLMTRIEDFARELKIDEITAFSLKGERSMFRKYGFGVDYTAFIKKIGEKNVEVKD